MTSQRHILLLAGSGEGRQIAQALAERSDLRVTVSEYLPDRVHGGWPLPARVGGFGGDAGFARFLAEERITAVLDATHPFAERVSRRTARICAEKAIPHLQVLRPAWTPADGEAWQEVPDMDAAAAMLRPGQRVFVTTGRALLAPLRYLPPETLFIRQIRPGPLPDGFQRAHQILGSGPFSEADEEETFRRLGIDVLVAKNSGSRQGRTKIAAATRLGVEILMLARPDPSGTTWVDTVERALDWVDAL